MNLNEYNITRGGISFTKLDEEAQRYAKLFAESKGVKLSEMAVVTQGVSKLRFRLPIENINKAYFHIDSPVRYDKNGNISVQCSLREKGSGEVMVLAHFSFSVVSRELILERLHCKKEERKVRQKKE